MTKREYKKLKKYEIVYYRGFYSLPFYVVEKVKKNKIKATIKRGGIVMEVSYKDFDKEVKYDINR